MRFGKSTFIILVIIIASLFGVIYYLFQSIDRSAKHDNMLLHSQRILNKADDLLKSNLKNESDSRAYALTLKDRFAEDYKSDSVDLSEIVTELADLVDGKTDQTILVDSIRLLSVKRFNMVSDFMDLPDDSLTSIKVKATILETSIITQELEDLANNIINNEELALDRHEEELSENFKRNRRGLILLILLLLVIVVVVGRFIYLNYRKLLVSKAHADADNDELKYIKKRYELSLIRAKVAVFDWKNDEQGLSWISSSLCEMLGYDPDEFEKLSTNITENLMHPDDRAEAKKTLKNHLEKGAPYYVSYRLRTKSGNYIPFRSSGDSYTLNGRSRTVGVIKSISDEIAMEKEQKALVEKWEEFSLRFELTLEASGYGVWDWADITKSEQWWSDTFYELIGHSREDLVPSIESFHTIIHPEDKPEMERKIEENLSDGTPLEIEYRLLTKSNGYQWFRASGNHIIDPVTGATRMIGVVSDISEEIMFTEELKRSNAELQNFAYVASHDLQEPLRKIQAFGDRLNFIYDQQQDLELPGRELVEKMNNAATRMRKLIQDLLNYSRVSREDRYKDNVELNEVISTVTNLLSELIEEKNVEIEVADDLPLIRNCNQGNLHQLFQNLISNAIKFQPPENTPKISITWDKLTFKEAFKVSPTLGNYSDYYRIAVKDNGIGFKEEYLDKIFTIFQRLHGRSEYTGTGLGLAICKKICENHEGYITAESTVGEGTTFYIILPDDKNTNHE